MPNLKNVFKSSNQFSGKKGLIGSDKKGFTLIELLIVISIIGLLSSIVLVSLKGATAKARDARRKQDIAQMMQALELYYLDYGQYPASGGANAPNNGWVNSGDNSWDTFATALKAYIILPKDPINNASIVVGDWAGGGKYNYDYSSQGYGCPQQWYKLVFKLEKPDIISPGITACDGTNFNFSGTITYGMRHQ